MKRNFLVLLLMMLIGGLAGPTWAVALLDVQEVHIAQLKDFWAGTPLALPYGIEVWVTGTGITSVSMLDPYNVNHVLSNSGPGSEWDFEALDFATLTDLNNSYGAGEYVFSFNGGADTVTIDYQYTEPTGFANITYPTDGETGVGLNPTYTWDSVVGDGDALVMWVVDNLGNDVYWDGPVLDMTRTSWQPVGALTGLSEYEFEISVLTADGGAPQTLNTGNSDSFDYYGLFEYINIVGFETIPEPATAISLLAMMGLYFVCRRS